jgi:hypothetical protein
MKKLLKLFVVIFFLSAIDMVSAMNKTTGQFSRKFGAPLESSMSISSCADFIKVAILKLQSLSEYIQEKKDMAARSRFANQTASDAFNKDVENSIKQQINEVRTLLDKADREAGAAI